MAEEQQKVVAVTAVSRKEGAAKPLLEATPAQTPPTADYFERLLNEPYTRASGWEKGIGEGESKALVVPSSESSAEQQLSAGNKRTRVELESSLDGNHRRNGRPAKIVATENRELRDSLVDQVQHIDKRVEAAKRTSSESLIMQADDLVAQIDEVKARLSEEGVGVRGSMQRLLTNRLNHIDDALRVALLQAGVEYTPPPKAEEYSDPIKRFLGFLTGGQEQLESLTATIQGMALRKGDLDPATMLVLQVKMGAMQQHIEFFSNLLNKALESTKTIMNVQV